MIVERQIAIHDESLGDISIDAIAAGYPNPAAEGKNVRPTGRAVYTVEMSAHDSVAMAAALGARRFHPVGRDWGGAEVWGASAHLPGAATAHIQADR